MKKIIFSILVASIFCLSFNKKNQPTVFLIGDSTMADKDTHDNPERGWGMVFPTFFNKEIKFENHAKNGRSTKSFRAQGLWDSVFVKLKKGDYVFIQFGHNDAKKEDSTRFADANTAYRANLRRYVQETRQKGAIPVLITPVMRRKFDEKGNFVDTHGQYPNVVKEVAAEMNVPLIDLHKKSEELIKSYGEEGSKKLFLHFPAGAHKRFPDGKKDDTHFSELGAKEIAKLVLDGVKELKLKIVKYLL